MNYIINPNWFYWLKVINTINVLLWVAWACFLCTIIISAIAIVLNKWRIDDTNERCESAIAEYKKHLKMWNRILFPSAIVLSVCSVALIFIPSKDTLIEIMIAKYATFENAEWTLETVKSAVDYVVGTISQMK